MPPPRVVRGVVRSVGGTPVAEAAIAIEQSPAPVPDVAALSDSAGRFALSVPMDGRYGVTCRAEGFELRRFEVDVSGDEEIVLELYRVRGPRR